MEVAMDKEYPGLEAKSKADTPVSTMTGVVCKPTSTSSKYLAGINEILYRTDWQHVVLGDIYLDKDTFVFIYYGGFKSSTPIAQGAAAVLCGLAGVLADRFTQGGVSDARPHYTKALREVWGMHPDRRANLYPSIRLEREDIKSLETEGGIAIETKNGTKYLFGYTEPNSAAEAAAIICDWHLGRLEAHESAIQTGIALECRPPYDIIEDAKKRDLPTPELYKALSVEKDYFTHLVDLYMSQNQKDRVRLLKIFEVAPSELKSIIVEKLLKGEQDAKCPEYVNDFETLLVRI
jgi:hypothetical protein